MNNIQEPISTQDTNVMKRKISSLQVNAFASEPHIPIEIQYENAQAVLGYMIDRSTDRCLTVCFAVLQYMST